MAISEQDTVELIITQLEANIADPLSSRVSAGKKWIYDDAPRPDITAYPRIAVESVPSNYDEFAVGSYEQIEFQTIVISVFARKKTTMTVGTKSCDRGEQVVDELSLQIRDFIKNAHPTWVSNGYLSIRPQTKNRDTIAERVVSTMTFVAQIKQ